jgi:hypothetical protein
MASPVDPSPPAFSPIPPGKRTRQFCDTARPCATERRGRKIALQIRLQQCRFFVIFQQSRQSYDIVAYCRTIIAIVSDGLLRTRLEVCLALKPAENPEFSKTVPARQKIRWL